VTFPDGTQNTEVIEKDGTETLSTADGMTYTRSAPQIHAGLLRPVSVVVRGKDASGLARMTTRTRTVTLADPTNLFSLLTQTDTTKVNGLAWTDLYDATTRVRTTTTPMGRVSSTTLNTKARPTSFADPGVLRSR